MLTGESFEPGHFIRKIALYSQDHEFLIPYMIPVDLGEQERKHHFRIMKKIRDFKEEHDNYLHKLCPITIFFIFQLLDSRTERKGLPGNIFKTGHNMKINAYSTPFQALSDRVSTYK